MKINFGALYSVDGALLPFLSVFFATEHGFSPSQIGLVFAVSAAASILAPVVLTLLADRFDQAERLLILSMIASAATLLAFTFAKGFWSVLIVYTAYSLFREPGRPLLDGIFFSSQRSLPALASVSYHQVRLWGTFGYMLPGLLLYFLVKEQGSLWTLPLLACGLQLIGVLTMFYLPSRSASRLSDRVVKAKEPLRLHELLKAAGKLLRVKTTAVFILAMFLLQASMAIYAAFYPLQVTEVIGLAPQWLGLIVNLGVLVEMAYIAAFGWLLNRLGWRRLMVVGAVAAALRLVLLASIPTVGVAIGTQLLHGLVIVVTLVAARQILDRRAPDEIRHTTQGLYAMLVAGGGRVAGSALGGLVAESSLAAAFWFSAGLAVVAAILLAWSLREENSRDPILS